MQAWGEAARQSNPPREKTSTENRPTLKHSGESMIIKTHSLSAVSTENSSTPYPKPTGTGKWNN